MEARTSLYAVPALLIALAAAGCSLTVKGGEDNPHDPNSGSQPGDTSDGSEPGSPADTAHNTPPPASKPTTPTTPTTPTPTTPPPPSSGCAQLCNGNCTPQKLAERSYIQDIAVHGQSVFFSGEIGYEGNTSFFGVVPKTGGTVVTLADDLGDAPKLLSDGASAYAIATSAFSDPLGSINELSPSGTFTSLPPYDIESTTAMALDAVNFYWWDWKNDTVRATPRSGGPSFLAADFLPWTDSMAFRDLHVDDTGLYVVADDVQTKLTTLWKAPKSFPANGTPLFSPVPHAIVSLTSDATHLYFVDRGDKIYRAPKSGGSVEKIAQYASNLSVAVDDERFYWFQGSALVATCKDGSGTQFLANADKISKYDPPGVLAVDSTGVYFRSSVAVFRVAK